MSEVNRREFMHRASLPLAGAAAVAGFSRDARAVEAPEPQAEQQDPLDLKTLPNFCAHEHWGSIDSIGMAEEGFRADVEQGAAPRRETGVWDLVLDPYFGGWLRAAGADPDALARNAGATDFRAWWRESPALALASMRPHLAAQQLTGAFQCIRRGVQFLYGTDIGTFDPGIWQAADAAVARRYASLFNWYRDAMSAARFSGLIRPVHPEFYLRDAPAADARSEAAFTKTVMRIDPLLAADEKSGKRLDALGGSVGVLPRDAETWRRFLDALFTRAGEGGAVGIKQLQAYSRPLDFPKPRDRDVRWKERRNPEESRVFQNWLVNECCRRAHDLHWPHQIHVGTHNLQESGPLPLERLARSYPDMPVVLLHCWPFLEASGWLAKHIGNVYIDSCWQCVLNPAYFREALRMWLGYIPANKMLCSHDATSVEMAVGASLFTREILAGQLGELSRVSTRDGQSLRQTAAALLHENAARLYGTRPWAGQP